MKPRSPATVLTPHDRVAATSDRFLRHFVNMWIAFSMAWWGFQSTQMPTVQYPFIAMFVIGVSARCSIAFGRMQLARYTLVVLWSCFVVVTPAFVNGVRTPVLLNIACTLVMTGWMLGRRALVVMTGVFLLAILGYWLAEARGWWVISTPMRSADVWAMVLVSLTCFTAFVVWSLVSNYEINFDQESALQQQLAQALRKAEAANQELAAMFRFNRTVLLDSPLPIGVYAANGQCVQANEAYAELAETTREALLKRNFHDIAAWRTSGMLEACLASLDNNQPHRREGVFNTPSGKQRWIESRVLPIEIAGAKHLLLQFIDRTEHKQLEEELQYLAFNDALTQLPNRRLLLDRLTQALHSSKRLGSAGAVLFLDLNRFKQLNDTHGHEAGDRLLVEVAHRLRDVVRESDTVARIGGDEFVVLLEGLGADRMQAGAYANAVADKIRLSLAQDVIIGDIRHQGSASIGIELFMGDDVDADQVLRQADLAMYQAKKGPMKNVHPPSIPSTA